MGPGFNLRYYMFFEELELPEIVGLILCFEGRIYHEFIRDFVESVYVHALP